MFQHSLQKYIWDKVSKNGPSKICGRKPLKNFKSFLSSTNFTWSILEYLVSYVSLDHSLRKRQRTFRRSHQEVSCKKGIHKSSAKLTGKHLRKSLFLNKVAGKKGLKHRFFPVNFSKFLTTPFFVEHFQCLLLIRIYQKPLSELVLHINLDVDLDREYFKNIFGRKQRVLAFSTICASIQLKSNS